VLLQSLRQSQEKFMPKKFGTTPVVIVSSTEEAHVRRSLFERTLLEASPNTTEILYSPTDHYIPYNDPQTIVNAIIKCLAKINAT